MNYALIEKTQLEAKGIFPYAETLPDGRAMLPLNYLKGVAGLTNIEIVSGEALKDLKKQQEESYVPAQSVNEDITDGTTGEGGDPEGVTQENPTTIDNTVTE